MSKLASHILYRKTESNCYYKVNSNIKRITKLFDNEVSYIDYDTNIKYVKSLKSIKLNVWKHFENSFFISRHFEWEYNGVKYRTTDKKIKWKDSPIYGLEALVFHNGKIWKANYNANYYPRVYLETKKFINPVRKVLFEKNMSKTESFINELNSVPNTAKWTDIKYCRNFEKIS